MAKKRASASAGENTSAYFKDIFAKEPRLLFEPSNRELLERWLSDHPGRRSVPTNIKNNLANVKSVLRKKTRSRGGPKQAQHVAAAGAAPSVGVPKLHRASVRGLEALEERIDDCLTLARTIDPEQLVDIIRLLRRARYQVVWKMGEP